MSFGPASRLARVALIAPAIVVVAASTGDAQAETRVAVTGGVATDQRGVQSNAISAVPRMTFVSSTGARLALDGNVTRFNGEAWSGCGRATLNKQDRLAGPVQLTFHG